MSDCSKVKAYWSIFNNQLDLGAHMGALGYVITLTCSLLGLGHNRVVIVLLVVA